MEAMPKDPTLLLTFGSIGLLLFGAMGYGIYTTKKVCSFVAALPINDPKYVVLVLIDEPTKAYAYGSTVAVPVAKEIIESLIVLEKIPPHSKENKIIVKKT